MRELCDFESSLGAGFSGVVVSLGGQTPNRLALGLLRAGIAILGTAAESIDRAEDRAKFSALCDALGIDQPRWARATEIAELDRQVEALGGFPVLVRPSYVLSGAAMRVAHSVVEPHRCLDGAARVSTQHPVVLSKFEQRARELDLDAVAQNGEIIAWAACAHIEDAGVHSSDATLVVPPLDGQNALPKAILERAKAITQALAKALRASGPLNVQLLWRDGEVKVIECNLRASRSLRLVSKALGYDFADAAMRAMLDAPRSSQTPPDPRVADPVVVKAPLFSFRRLGGADPLLGVEMTATSEVAAFGRSRDEALGKALLAAGFRFPRRGVLLSLGPPGEKSRFFDAARALCRLGLPLYATAGTAQAPGEAAISCVVVDKLEAPDSPPLARLRDGSIDLVINLPRSYDETGRPDGLAIRRTAVNLDIPLVTELELARAIVEVLTSGVLAQRSILAWRDYLPTDSRLRKIP